MLPRRRCMPRRHADAFSAPALCLPPPCFTFSLPKMLPRAADFDDFIFFTAGASCLPFTADAPFISPRCARLQLIALMPPRATPAAPMMPRTGASRCRRRQLFDYLLSHCRLYFAIVPLFH